MAYNTKGHQGAGVVNYNTSLSEKLDECFLKWYSSYLFYSNDSDYVINKKYTLPPPPVVEVVVE